MKFKSLSLAFAFILALALASCGGNSANSKPTGDPVKDAKTLAEKFKSVKNVDDAKNVDKLVDEFSNYYEDKGGEDLNKWNEESAKMLNDSEVMAAMFKAAALLATEKKE